MNLNLHKLRVFREVIRTGSISQAATNLGRTQPAVSLSVSNLEEDSGLVLFERSQGRLLPTPEAYFLLGLANSILERADDLSRTIKDLSKLKRGRLSIAFFPVSSHHLIPDLVARFTRDKPEVKISLFSRTTSVIQESITSQQFDIGLSEKVPEHPALNITNYELPCVCAVRKDDPMAKNTLIRARDLSGKPIATLPDGSVSFSDLQLSFQKDDSELDRRFEIMTSQIGVKLSEQGLCYCVCDAISAFSYFATSCGNGPLTFRPFSPDVTLSISVLQPALRPPSKIAIAFKELLCEEITRIMNIDWRNPPGSNS